MSRTTIDFGIDLGTTNSAIALLKGVATEIIKNNLDADITPSAVSINKRGELTTGLRAKNRQIETPDDTYQEFKRAMGTDHLYRFKASGETRRPEELSAEILKALRGDVQQRTGELIESCVVTVPAVFELHQCDATAKAAKLAGFAESPLLQEPVAAALAHGFQIDSEKAYWLVYDLGGGTFDAALLKAEEGTIHVVNHAGDNFLGGSDIDWAIVEKLIIPKMHAAFGLRDLKRGNLKWRSLFLKLKAEAEKAKVELSRRERTSLETIRFLDDDGEEQEFDCPLLQNEVVQVSEPFIMRSIEIARRVLSEKNLGKDAVAKVILVGGPTLAPYLREMLKNELGMSLDFSVDPMTVVARGAAIFAGTQRVSAGTPVAVKPGQFHVEIAKSFQPVGAEDAPLIAGKVGAAGVQNFSGFTIEFVDEQSRWSSGQIGLRADGVFTTELFADRGRQNVFAIEVRNAAGVRQVTTPETVAYSIGAVVDEQPLINSVGVEMADGKFDRLFEKGRGLPVRTTTVYRTVRLVKQGQSSEAIKIPIIEGENDRADRNRWVGELAITGENVPRDLPLESEIEVTVKIDESRKVWVAAYVPYLNEEFKTILELERKVPKPDELQRHADAEMQRLREVRSKAAVSGDEKVERLVETLDAHQLGNELRNAAEAAKGDPVGALKCEKQIQELRLKLDEIEDALEWPALVTDSREWVEELQRVVGRHGDAAQRQRAAELSLEVEQLIQERDTVRLRKKRDQMEQLYFRIVLEQPGFWVEAFRNLEQNRGKMSDQARAARLLDQGRECLAKNNLDGLKNVVHQCWAMLPREVVAAVQRGYQSGIIKG